MKAYGTVSKVFKNGFYPFVVFGMNPKTKITYEEIEEDGTAFKAILTNENGCKAVITKNWDIAHFDVCGLTADFNVKPYSSVGIEEKDGILFLYLTFKDKPIYSKAVYYRVVGFPFNKVPIVKEVRTKRVREAVLRSAFGTEPLILNMSYACTLKINNGGVAVKCENFDADIVCTDCQCKKVAVRNFYIDASFNFNWPEEKIAVVEDGDKIYIGTSKDMKNIRIWVVGNGKFVLTKSVPVFDRSKKL